MATRRQPAVPGAHLIREAEAISAGAVARAAIIAALAGLVTGGRAVVRGGGWLGGFVGVALGGLLGGPGAFLLLAVVLVVALVLATGVSAIEVSGRAARWLAAAARAGAARLRRHPPAAEEPSETPRPKLPLLPDDAVAP